MTSTIVYQRTYYGGADGLPLNSGKVYIGEANKDPQVYPVACYWDEALTITATQPLTVTSGYIVNNGLRAPVYTAADSYSVRVCDRAGVQVDYLPNAGSADSTLRGDLAASTGLSLIGTPQSITAEELLFERSALSLAKPPKSFARTWQQCLDQSADLTEMRGFALQAGTTGGLGKTVYKVWNDSDDVNTVGSLRWAVAQAKANGGGRIIGVPVGQHTVQLRSRIFIDFDNVTVDFPGRNWRFGALNDVEMVRVTGRNVIVRRMSLFRYPHYTSVDNQFIEYSAENGNLVAGQTAFAISFPFFVSSDIRVAKNKFVTLEEGTDYTITGGGGPSGSTGTLTLTSAVSATDNIRIFGKLYQQDGISVRPELCDKVWIDQCTFTDHTDGACDITSALVDVNVAATALVVGARYQITTLGTTDWRIPSGAPAWAISTAYTVGQKVTNGSNIYTCITAGTSAGSGGPTGTGTSIADNTVVWSYTSAAPTFAVGSVFVCAAVGTGTGVARSPDARITVSRCHFRDQLECMAIGSSATSAQTPPPAWAATALDQAAIVNVTLDRNVFEACSQRSPRVGGLAYVHSVNNVHIMSAYRRDDGTTSAQYASWATTGGKLYSQNDYLMLGGKDIPANGMYANTTAWDAGTRLGPGAFNYVGTVAEAGITLTTANTSYAAAPSYSIAADPVPSTGRLDYAFSRVSQAGAEVSPLSEMVYAFVSKEAGDAADLWPDGFNVVSVPGGYRVRMQSAVPSTGSNPNTDFTAGSLAFPRGTTITLVSDTATLRTGTAFYAIDTEGAAATDTLATISPAVGTTLPDGYILGLRIASNSRTITVVGTGNISLPNGPIALTSTSTQLWLRWGESMNTWSVMACNARQEGEYTPTLTGVANVASSSVTRCFWSREHGSNFVNVWFNVSVTPTANTTLTDLGLTLPVASNLAVGNDAIGYGSVGAAAALNPLIVFGDATNDRATIRFTSNTTSACAAIGSFRYRVI